MGAAPSNLDRNTSKAIDAELQKRKKTFANTFRLIVLGDDDRNVMRSITQDTKQSSRTLSQFRVEDIEFEALALRQPQPRHEGRILWKTSVRSLHVKSNTKQMEYLADCYYSVDAILCVVPLSSFHTGRLTTLLEQFRQACHYFAQESSIVLYFTEQEKFGELLFDHDFDSLFPNYPGDPEDVDAATRFIKRVFYETYKRQQPDASLVHSLFLTCDRETSLRNFRPYFFKTMQSVAVATSLRSSFLVAEPPNNDHRNNDSILSSRYKDRKEELRKRETEKAASSGRTSYTSKSSRYSSKEVSSSHF